MNNKTPDSMLDKSKTCDKQIDSFLEEKIDKLQIEIELKNNQIEKAGQFGLELMETNTVMQKKMIDESNKYMKRMENLSQENFSLKQQIKVMKKCKEELEAEIDIGQDAISRCKNEFQLEINEMKEKHSLTLLKNNEIFENEINFNEKKCKLLMDETEYLKQEIEKLSCELVESKKSSNPKVISNITDENDLLRNEKMILSNKLFNVEREKMLTDKQLADNNMEMKRLKIDLMDSRNEVTSYLKSLKESRNQVKELQFEIDDINLKSNQHNKRGNSLFAEVDDRRIQAEKELINYKLKYENLLRNYKISNETMEKMRVQVGSFFQINNGRRQIDKERIEKLELDLQNIKQEMNYYVKDLASKNEELNKYRIIDKQFQQLKLDKVEFEYVDYLKEILKKKDSEIDKISEDLKLERTFRLTTSNELTITQRRLFDVEMEFEQLKSKYLHVQGEINCLKEKNEFDNVNNKDQQNKDNLIEELSDDDLIDSPLQNIVVKPILNEDSNIIDVNSAIPKENVKQKKKKTVSVSDTKEIFNYTPQVAKIGKQYTNKIDMANLDDKNDECKTQ